MKNATSDELRGTIETLLAQKVDPKVLIDSAPYGSENWYKFIPGCPFLSVDTHKYRVRPVQPLVEPEPWGYDEWLDFMCARKRVWLESNWTCSLGVTGISKDTITINGHIMSFEDAARDYVQVNSHPFHKEQA